MTDTLARYALGGLVSYGVVVGTTTVAHELFGLPETAAAALGLGTAFVVNFLMLRHVVFSRAAPGALPQQALLFLASAGLFRGLEYVAFLIGYAVTTQHYALVLTLVLAGSSSLKFLVYRWIFARA